MAHAFDTGLAKPQRAVVRDAIVTRLAPLLQTGAAAGLYVKKIAGVVGRLSKDDTDLILAECQGQCPAILVGLGKKDVSARSVTGPGDRFSGELDVYVYVVVDTLRKPDVHRVAGDAASGASLQADPGTETILEHLEELLVGFHPTDASKSVHHLVYEAEDELGHFDEITVWEQIYSVQLERALKRGKGITEAVTAIRTRHHESSGGAQNPLITSEQNV